MTETVADHECDTGHFDRTLCPEPCGAMHSYCATCGALQDACAHVHAPRFKADLATKLREAVAYAEQVGDTGVSLTRLYAILAPVDGSPGHGGNDD